MSIGFAFYYTLKVFIYMCILNHSLIWVCTESSGHQPVPGDQGESHPIGQADAACGETIPWWIRTQCSIPGAGSLHLQVKYPCLPLLLGRPWHNRYSSCTTNVYKLDVYAGARGFDPELRQYASRVPSPCGLTVVYKISPSLNLASRDIACTEWNRQ